MSGNLPEAVRRLLALPEDERKIGAFRLRQQLGQGGFAPVWLADEIAGSTTLRQAAVKLFQLAPSAEARQAIIDEAERLCRLEHPNVVRFYALPIDEARGVAGLAMEYVAGRSLAQVLTDPGKRLSTRETIDVGIAVASALTAVHGAGLVHRDVTPANVVLNQALSGPSAYKLIDFGIAVRPHDGKTGTGSGRLALPFGKRGFIDPVCYRAFQPATSASDLYALGAVLFVCMTRRIPAAGRGEIDEDILAGRRRAPRLSELITDLPAALVDLVAALLDPDPSRRPRSAEAVAIELERLRAAFSGRRRVLPPEEEGPFRGLARFEREHRDVFFGRRSEVAAVLSALRTRGLVALVGPSGSGKSSLARAGVVPAVEDGALGGVARWEAVILMPTADPRRAIEMALFPSVKVDPARSAVEAVAAVEAWVEEGKRGLLLLVDQLEELTTLAQPNDGLDESRAWARDFLARIGERPHPLLRAVVTVRRDLMDPLLSHHALGRALMAGTVLVSPLQDAAWSEVIDAALESYGYALEDEALRKELLDALSGTARAMPLVEFALAKLWRRRDRARKQITRAGLSSIGGLSGALERHAEATLSRAQPLGVSVDAVRRVLLSLTTPAGARVARTHAALTDEGRDEQAKAAVRVLEEARLLVREREGITLAHEALLTQWRRLRGWLAEVSRDRLVVEALEGDAERWAGTRDRDLLWGGRRLATVREVMKRGTVAIDRPGRQFYRASVRAQWLRWSAVVLGIAGAVLLSAGVAQRVRAEGQRKQRLAQQEAETQKERADENARKVQESEQRCAGLLQQVQQRCEAERPLDPGMHQEVTQYLQGRPLLPLPPAPPAPSSASAPPAIPLPPVMAASAEIPPAEVEGTAAAPLPMPAPSASATAAPGTLPLDRGALYTALRTAAKEAQARCQGDEGRHGKGRVEVTFAPDGTVSRVKLDPPFSGTAVGDCVQQAFRDARVPPFAGPPYPASWSFSVGALEH
jgi:hypothetical protein